MKTRLIAVVTCMVGLLAVAFPMSVRGELRAGAAKVDVTPLQLPVLVNGGMTSRSAGEVTSRLYARAIVVDDHGERLAIVVVDSCMMPRPLLDDAKQLASQRTKIKPERMLISATHTHTAPASMGCLGTSADPTYVPYLREKLAEAVATAEKNLEPARVGWAVRDAAEFTALRRWIRRPDRLANDPFGNPTVRANMHAGRNWDDVTGESGPEDPDLSLISFESNEGRPIAVLANFSMHYFSGVKPLNADYFGMFCAGLEQRIGKATPGAATGTSTSGKHEFVALMSHGCSGDIWRRDYKHPERKDPTIDVYVKGLVDIAGAAHESIEHRTPASIAMKETRMTLAYRVPDQQRLQWAQQIVEQMGDRLPKTQQEVYAREQVILHERQNTEIVVQALRIGEIAIATTPNETYALTGLKIKHQSPLRQTMVIELANGGDGYIPPPEQHHLGGYNTWAARSAGLEVQAEPKIVEAALAGLESVTQRPRKTYRQSRGPGVTAILETRPIAYWRLDEFSGPHARDTSSNSEQATFENGVAYFLDGPLSDHFCNNGETNRAVHFAGGRLRAQLEKLQDRYSVSLWCWNGMPADGRGTAGWLFSRGRPFGQVGDHLGVGGKETGEPGKLVFQQVDALGNRAEANGQTTIDRWTWNHVVLVREGAKTRVYLNGKLDLELDSKLTAPIGIDQCFLAGRSNGDSSWEGRLDEVAVYDRPLSEIEIQRLRGAE